jgi:hypothetical protein
VNKMKNKNPTIFALPTSLPTQTTPSPKRSRKKIYVTLAAVIAIVVIVSAAMLIPQTNADIISLGVHYKVGEKLTYDITSALSTSGLDGASSNIKTDSTVTIEVVKFEGDTYTLNYTYTLSALGSSISYSKLVDVKESQMVTTLALLPVAIQMFGSAFASSNESEPLMTGVFDQTQAKVGDSWTVPLSTTDSTSPSGQILVTFKAIQDLTVQAGTYKVFRIDFNVTVSQDSSSSLVTFSPNVSGQAYLESGTCKQIKSELTLDMTADISGGSYGMTYAITSTLTSDSQ